jgi:minor curlin subunit
MRRPLIGRVRIRPAGSLRLAAVALIAALSIPTAHAQDCRTRYGRVSGAEVQQAGLNNRASASQNGAANAATIAQAGSELSGAVSQNGDGNTATIRQFGKANSGTISQTGSDNTACLIQVGKNLSTDIVQEGDGQARGVIQTRKGTREISPDRCDVQMTRGFLMRGAKQAR